MNLFLNSSVSLSASSQRWKSVFSFPRLTLLSSFILHLLLLYLLLDHSPKSSPYFSYPFSFSCIYSFLLIDWHVVVPVTITAFSLSLPYSSNLLFPLPLQDFAKALAAFIAINVTHVMLTSPHHLQSAFYP